jgi:hypothetical protein
MKKRIAGRKAQVAVEFIIMFAIVGFVVFYIWRLSITVTALQLREYATFMVGRAVTASYSTNAVKIAAAKEVMADYNGADGIKNISLGAASPIDCFFGNNEQNGGRNLFGSPVDWDFVADAGVTCSIQLYGIVPVGGPLGVVSESMTGSEITDAHCGCALDFGASWKGCINGSGKTGYTDNGC